MYANLMRNASCLLLIVGNEVRYLHLVNYVEELARVCVLYGGVEVAASLFV